MRLDPSSLLQFVVPKHSVDGQRAKSQISTMVGQDLVQPMPDLPRRSRTCPFESLDEGCNGLAEHGIGNLDNRTIRHFGVLKQGLARPPSCKS
jgi:hypothetical protein